jgi:hypothetical protein
MIGLFSKFCPNQPIENLISTSLTLNQSNRDWVWKSGLATEGSSLVLDCDGKGIFVADDVAIERVALYRFSTSLTD